MSQIRVTGNKVGVFPILELTTDWGFQLPDNTNEPAIHNKFPTLRGVIFAIGANVDPAHQVNIGDHVLFFNHNRNKIVVDEQLINILPIDEIIGVYVDSEV